ncbi:Uma2 family endonuclease [Leptolyngbya sp. AN03gr2]|uniref:Uma2 family endonuclease n=1 Tax=unclassified Leptolyngbya TaxID=2650499 RepID=UPI003D31AF8A
MTQAIPKDTLLAHDAPFPPPGLWSDEPPLESDLHRDQIDLLVRLIRWIFRPNGIGDRSDVYVAGNLTVYYSPNQKKSEFFRGPDVFVVLGTDPRRRKSWAVWHENGQYPNLIIELLSDSTAEVDRGEKKQIYQSIWRVPEYFWFDPVTLEFQGFQLIHGQYESLAPNSQGHFWSQELGFYLGIHDRQLRLFTENGSLVPLPEEAAEERAEQAEQRADEAEQRAEILAAKLRELGIDPDQLS